MYFLYITIKLILHKVYDDFGIFTKYFKEMVKLELTKIVNLPKMSTKLAAFVEGIQTILTGVNHLYQQQPAIVTLSWVLNQ